MSLAKQALDCAPGFVGSPQLQCSPTGCCGAFGNGGQRDHHRKTLKKHPKTSYIHVTEDHDVAKGNTHILRICVLKSWRLPGLQATIITNLRHRFLYPHGPLHSHSLWGAARGLPSITSWLRQKTFTSAKGTFYDEQSHQFAWVLFLRWFGKFSENVQVFFPKNVPWGTKPFFGWGWVPWLGQPTAGSGSCTTPWGWKSAEIHQRYGILEQRNGSGIMGEDGRARASGGPGRLPLIINPIYNIHLP